jgi:hypothetical protein
MTNAVSPVLTERFRALMEPFCSEHGLRVLDKKQDNHPKRVSISVGAKEHAGQPVDYARLLETLLPGEVTKRILSRGNPVSLFTEVRLFSEHGPGISETTVYLTADIWLYT